MRACVCSRSTLNNIKKDLPGLTACAGALPGGYISLFLFIVSSLNTPLKLYIYNIYYNIINIIIYISPSGGTTKLKTSSLAEGGEITNRESVVLSVYNSVTSVCGRELVCAMCARELARRASVCAYRS